MLGKINCVFWDAGNVFIFPNGKFLKEEIYKKTNIIIDEVKLKYSFLITDKLNLNSSKSYQEEWTEYVFGDLEYLYFWGYLTDEFNHRYWNLLDEEIKDVTKKLREISIDSHIISNTDGKLKADLKMLSIDKCFNYVADSTIVGIEKPDPRIFNLALKETNSKPQDSIYIGDSINEVIAAQKIGFNAVLFDPLNLYSEENINSINKINELIELLEDKK